MDIENLTLAEVRQKLDKANPDLITEEELTELLKVDNMLYDLIHKFADLFVESKIRILQRTFDNLVKEFNIINI